MAVVIYANTSSTECGAIYLSWKIERILRLIKSQGSSINGPDVVMPTKPATTWKTFIKVERGYKGNYLIFRAQPLNIPKLEKKFEIKYVVTFQDTSCKIEDVEHEGTVCTVEGEEACAYYNLYCDLSGESDLVLKCCFKVFECSTSSFGVPKNNTSSLLDSLRALHSSKMLSDFTIFVKNKTIPVHKNILASRSPVFAAMFKNETLEMLGNKLVIEDFDFKIVETFILYLYTGQLGECTVEECFQLYSVSDKYSVESLKNTCSHKLIECINVGNAYDVYALGYLNNDAALKTAAKSFVRRNISSVLKTERWRKYISENSQLAAELLKETERT